MEEIREDLTTADLVKKYDLHPTMISGWKRTAIENMAAAFDLRSLEDEKGRLKRMLADAMLDNAALKDLLEKNVWSASSVQGIAISQKR